MINHRFALLLSWCAFVHDHSTEAFQQQVPRKTGMPALPPAVLPATTSFTAGQLESSSTLFSTSNDKVDVVMEREKESRGFSFSNAVANDKEKQSHSRQRLDDNNDSDVEWYNQEEYQQKRKQQRQWLIRTTNSLIDTEAGSLIKGKWHELRSMLYAWGSFVKSDADAPLRMERIIKRLHDERSAGNQEAMVDIDMYNRLLDAWACAALFNPSRRKDSPLQASQRAREILVTLQETYEAEGDDLVMPNEESFNVVLHVVCRIEGPAIARRLLALMEYLQRSGKNPLAQPSRNDYISVLNAYSQPRRYGHSSHQQWKTNAGALAEGFLRHMNITAGIVPDTFCYNLAIKAWSQSKKGREAAEHADRVLEEMQAPKDIVTYASVISTWAASGMRAHAVERVEELLRQIEDDPELEPNTIVVNSVMSAWVKSRSPGACNRTEELLHQMEQSSEPTLQPDLITYNTHLHALSLQAKKPGFAQRADALLQRMEQRHEAGEVAFSPNLFSYNLVIEAWSKSPAPHAPIQAAGVLRKLTKAAAQQGQQCHSLPTTPERYERLPPRNKPPLLEPDTFSFNRVLAALSRSSAKGSARMAEELLGYMEKAYANKVHPHAKPDEMSYVNVIQAYARSGEPGAAIKAEKLLHNVKLNFIASSSDSDNSSNTDLRPTRNMYNAVIDCWAKSGAGTLGARKAEALLQEMQEMKEAYDDEAMAPNLVTFNCVLNAWALSGTRCCGYKAESYLNQMWELYNAGDNNLVKPNEKTYNTVINAISKSKNEAKAQRALRILRRMDKNYQAGLNKEARPNEVTYTAVLNSCAFPAVLDERTRRKALDTAIFTLEELTASRYGHPNQITYATFFKACGNLLSDDDELRRAVIQEAFQQCCKDGQVGDMVLTQLQRAAPADLYHDLVVKPVLRRNSSAHDTIVRRRIKIDDLPPKWRSNVRARRANNWKPRHATPWRQQKPQIGKSSFS